MRPGRPVGRGQIPDAGSAARRSTAGQLTSTYPGGRSLVSLRSSLKREVAKALLRDLWLARTGVLSAQVLHEFYVNITRRITTPLSKAEARRVVGTYIPWCLEPKTGDVNEAFRIEDEASISFWDALIVATAARSGVPRALSEDLNPGQIIPGVTVVNPFAR